MSIYTTSEIKKFSPQDWEKLFLSTQKDKFITLITKEGDHLGKFLFLELFLRVSKQSFIDMSPTIQAKIWKTFKNGTYDLPSLGFGWGSTEKQQKNHAEVFYSSWKFGEINWCANTNKIGQLAGVFNSVPKKGEDNYYFIKKLVDLGRKDEVWKEYIKQNLFPTLLSKCYWFSDGKRQTIVYCINKAESSNLKRKFSLSKSMKSKKLL